MRHLNEFAGPIILNNLLENVMAYQFERREQAEVRDRYLMRAIVVRLACRTTLGRGAKCSAGPNFWPGPIAYVRNLFSGSA